MREVRVEVGGGWGRCTVCMCLRVCVFSQREEAADKETETSRQLPAELWNNSVSGWRMMRRGRLASQASSSLPPEQPITEPECTAAHTLGEEYCQGGGVEERRRNKMRGCQRVEDKSRKEDSTEKVNKYIQQNCDGIDSTGGLQGAREQVRWLSQLFLQWSIRLTEQQERLERERERKVKSSDYFVPTWL